MLSHVVARCLFSVFQQPPAANLGSKLRAAAFGLLVTALSPALSAATVSAAGTPQVIGNSGDTFGVAWRDSENGVRPLFISFPVFLPCMGRRGFPVVVDEVNVAHYRR